MATQGGGPIPPSSPGTGPGAPGTPPHYEGQQPGYAGAPATAPYPPPPAQYPPGYGAGQDGPGFQDRASHAMEQFTRHVKTPETKEFFKTSEFMVWAATVIAIIVAGAAISGDGDNFVGRQVWLYVAIVSGAYIISRGLAKAGARRGYGDAPMDRG
jgi:hypothetical protein